MLKQEMRWLDEEAIVHRAIPLRVSLKSETFGFVASPKLGVTAGVISAIRVQDVLLDTWFNWDRPGPFVPSTPIITPGVNNLYIAFWAINQGTTGNLTLTIKESGGRDLATKTVSCAYGAGVGIEVTVNMPSVIYGIILTVTP